MSLDAFLEWKSLSFSALRQIIGGQAAAEQLVMKL